MLPTFWNELLKIKKYILKCSKFKNFDANFWKKMHSLYVCRLFCIILEYFGWIPWMREILNKFFKHLVFQVVFRSFSSLRATHSPTLFVLAVENCCEPYINTFWEHIICNPSNCFHLLINAIQTPRSAISQKRFHSPISAQFQFVETLMKLLSFEDLLRTRIACHGYAGVSDCFDFTKYFSPWCFWKLVWLFHSHFQLSKIVWQFHVAFKETRNLCRQMLKQNTDAFCGHLFTAHLCTIQTSICLESNQTRKIARLLASPRRSECRCIAKAFHADLLVN